MACGRRSCENCLGLMLCVCCALQDAKIGDLFCDFPPVLQLHLKRFEYDLERDMRVKVPAAVAALHTGSQMSTPHQSSEHPELSHPGHTERKFTLCTDQRPV
jgi:hypothetical protein